MVSSLTWKPNHPFFKVLSITYVFEQIRHSLNSKHPFCRNFIGGHGIRTIQAKCCSTESRRISTSSPRKWSRRRWRVLRRVRRWAVGTSSRCWWRSPVCRPSAPKSWSQRSGGWQSFGPHHPGKDRQHVGCSRRERSVNEFIYLQNTEWDCCIIHTAYIGS